MNRDIHLCREGDCRKVDLSFIYPDWTIKDYGLCCKECDRRDKCSVVCDIINHKHLKVEDCSFRKNYKNTLEEILEDKRESLILIQREIAKLEKEIADIEERLNIKSPLDCKICGSNKVIYDTTTALLSCPPKYKGECVCGSVQYIDTQVYRNTKKK